MYAGMGLTKRPGLRGMLGCLTMHSPYGSGNGCREGRDYHLSLIPDSVVFRCSQELLYLLLRASNVSGSQEANTNEYHY